MAVVVAPPGGAQTSVHSVPSVTRPRGTRRARRAYPRRSAKLAGHLPLPGAPGRGLAVARTPGSTTTPSSKGAEARSFESVSRAKSGRTSVLYSGTGVVRVEGTCPAPTRLDLQHRNSVSTWRTKASRVPGLASRTLLVSRSARTSPMFSAGSPPGHVSLTTGAARNGPSTARRSSHSVLFDWVRAWGRRPFRFIVSS